LKLIRVSTFVTSQARRLVFREKQRDDLHTAVWNFVTIHPMMDKAEFVSFEASVASYIANLIFAYNPDYAAMAITHYATILDEEGCRDTLTKYNDLKSNWSKLTRVIIDQIRVIRRMNMSISEESVDFNEMESDLRDYFMLSDSSIIHSFVEHLQLSGVVISDDAR